MLLDKQQFSLIILIAVVVGGLSGAVVGPFAIDMERSGSPGILSTSESGTLQETSYTDEESAVVDVVRRTNPAVVNIGIFEKASSVVGRGAIPSRLMILAPGFLSSLRRLNRLRRRGARR